MSDKITPNSLDSLDFPTVNNSHWPPKQVRLMRGTTMYQEWHPATLQDFADRKRQAYTSYQLGLS